MIKDTRLAMSLKKLDRPPAGANWVRLVREDVLSTVSAILAFIRGIPPFNYRPAYIAIRDVIEWGSNEETALRIVSEKGSPAGRAQNKALLRAFLEYDRTRRFSAANPVTFEPGYFAVSREVRVPVAPLSVIREHGRFLPIFLCGWNSIPLSTFQRRLLMTIIDDAFLSLTDFASSPAEVLFFPKDPLSKEGKRTAEVWHRGQYALLSKSELDQAVEIFVEARRAAFDILMSAFPQPSEVDSEREGGTEGWLFPEPMKPKNP